MTGLPPYLGKSALAKVELVVNSNNREMLTRCLKFDQFDNFTTKSWKRQILDEVSQTRSVLKDAAKLSPVWSLVNDLLSNMMEFLEELFSWMTSQYTELRVQKGDGSEEDNWKFISHAVSRIFDKLHKVRMYGQQCTPVGQAWHCLKANELQKELMEKNFLEHQIMLNVLHCHLKNNVVTKTQFNAEKVRVKKEFTNLTKRIQQIASKNGKKNNNP